MSKRITVALALASMAAAPAFAQSIFDNQRSDRTIGHIGVSAGQSTFRTDCSSLFDCDKKDTAFRILGGYQINRNFAAELGYQDLGKVTLSAPGVSFNIKANVWELVGIGAYPFANQFSGYGKLGAYHGESKASAAVAGFGSGSLKETNTDLTFGLGVQYDVSRELGVRGEWQRYKNVGGDDTGGKHDIDVISIGLIWRFH